MSRAWIVVCTCALLAGGTFGVACSKGGRPPAAAKAEPEQSRSAKVGAGELVPIAQPPRGKAQLVEVAAFGDKLVTTAAVSSDGRKFVSGVAPRASLWWLSGHRSPEPAQRIALQQLSLEPVLDLGLRLGEDAGERVADVGDVERRVGVHLLASTRAEVVHDVHLVAARHQRVDERRPDEARTPRDDGPHPPIL